MQIVKLKTKPSRRVCAWAEIKWQAKELIEYIDKGEYIHKFCQDQFGKPVEHVDKRPALPLAHCQVDEWPFAFFVVNKDLKAMGIPDEFPRVVINPRIIGGVGMRKEIEGCMSFPHDAPTMVRRYKEIVCEYETQEGETIRRTLNGLAAQMFQHETDHMNGRHI